MSLDVKALVQLVEGSGVHYRQNSVSWIFDCPRCSKRDKLYLRKRDGRFVCWYCATISGYRGKPEYALSDILGVHIKELQERLYGEGGGIDPGYDVELYFEDFFGDTDDIPYDLLPLRAMTVPLDFYPLDHKFAARGLAYAQKRGIGLQLAEEYGLLYHPQDRRLIFPIVVDGRTVGWQARTTEPTEWWDEEAKVLRKAEKILTPPGVDRDRCVMFQDRLKGSPHAVICEGPIDAIKAHLCGGNVATMGKSISRGQIKVIRETGVKSIYLALDPDAAAEASRLCREFADLEVYFMRIPKEFEDIGEMSPEAVFRLFQNAERVNASHVFLAPHLDFFTVVGK